MKSSEIETPNIVEEVIASIEPEVVAIENKEPQVVAYNRNVSKLNTGNVGIKDTLEPKKELSENNQEENLKPRLKEDFSFEELKALWREYALGVKRENRDLLFSTLSNSELQLSSDYEITMEIVNTVQSVELDREKSELVSFLRSRLKNDYITFKTKMTESVKVSVVDSKSNFERLAAENEALNKFRKLFNLDVEF